MVNAIQTPGRSDWWFHIFKNINFMYPPSDTNCKVLFSLIRRKIQTGCHYSFCNNNGFSSIFSACWIRSNWDYVAKIKFVREIQIDYAKMRRDSFTVDHSLRGNLNRVFSFYGKSYLCGNLHIIVPYWDRELWCDSIWVSSYIFPTLLDTLFQRIGF